MTDSGKGVAESFLNGRLRTLAQPGLEVGFISADDDLSRVWEFDNRMYGPSGNISFEVLRRWVETFPYGGYALKRGGELKGVMGLWPVSEAASRQICEGGENESQVVPLSPVGVALASRHWYFAGIAVDPALRGTRQSAFFLLGAFALWLRTTTAEPPVTLCAIGHSADGVRMLQKGGFAETGRGEGGSRRFRRALRVWADLPRLFVRGVRQADH